MKHDPIVNQTTIDAGDFILRPLRKSDQGMIEFYGGDERVARMTATIPHPVPPGHAADFVNRAMAEGTAEFVWAIDASHIGGAEVMGLISLERMDRNQSEIGYWVAPTFWNGGVAQRAVNALICTNPLGNRTVFASVFQDNPASAKVLSNLGFTYLGDAERFSVARDAAVATWTYHKNLDDAAG